MSTLSASPARQKRRRFSPEFKSRIVAACTQPGVSVSRIALDNSLNANMVRRWMREFQQVSQSPASAPAFMPITLPAAPDCDAKSRGERHTIRIEIPRAGGPVVVEWPADQAHQCIALLRELLG